MPMIVQLTPQETNLLISAHHEVDGCTDNLAVSYELLRGEADTLEEARHEEALPDYFKKVVKKAQQRRKSEDRSKTGRAPLDMDESRFFVEVGHRERKEGAPPPASDMYFLSNILGWNAEEKYNCLEGGYQEIAKKLWQEVDQRFSAKKKVYVECFRLYTGNPGYWSYQELGEEFGIEPGTIRAGVHRVKKELIRLIHQIENHTFAPPHSEIPKDILAARRLFENKELEEAQALLDALASTYEENPFYYKTLGDLASEKKLDHNAIEWYQKALAYADDPILRSRICNNWAFTTDAIDDKEGAIKLWLRALRLDPNNYVPRFNIMCEDALAKNMTACKHHLDEFGKLLAKDALSPEDRADLLASLEDETELAWVRSIKPFRRRISSWQSRYGLPQHTCAQAACHPIAVIAAIVMACLFFFGNIQPQSHYTTSPNTQTISTTNQPTHLSAKKKQRKGKKKQHQLTA